MDRYREENTLHINGSLNQRHRNGKFGGVDRAYL